MPASVVEGITRAGGLVTPDAWWIGQCAPAGVLLSDEAVDRIEQIANDETPGPRRDS